MQDCTEYCVRDCSEGPGEYVKRFRAAKAAKKLSEAQRAAVDKYKNTHLGPWSKILCYSPALCGANKNELRALYGAIKGGHMRVMRTSEGEYLLCATT